MLVAAWEDYEMDRTEVIDTRSLVLYYTMITKIEVRLRALKVLRAYAQFVLKLGIIGHKGCPGE